MHTDHFEQLLLNKAILRALSKEGYQEPTEIQKAAIPEALAGRDVLATAQTGTGKTAAFALPILHLLNERTERAPKGIRALVLTPTRELALQIDESFRAYGRYLPLRAAVVLGGVPSGPQIKALRKIPDILIATPGRLLDLASQGHLRFDRIEMLVLDEADRMLDLGFVRDVRKIVAKLPRSRQTMFFSATLTAEIARLASDMLRSPTYVAASPPASVSGNISQKVLFVEQGQKLALLTRILKEGNMGRTLVFTRTKHRADRVKRQLSSEGISVDSIHSNKTQGARQRALSSFDRGKIQVLVATDIVARGIDVEGISHVVNFELPGDPESYVHRIGRTARAGAEGTALSFCDFQEMAMLRAIEKLIKRPLAAVEDHPFRSVSLGNLRAGTPSPANGIARAKRTRSKSRMFRRGPRRRPL
jgi:ATP-dependent RNA helicase RhlE